MILADEYINLQKNKDRKDEENTQKEEILDKVKQPQTTYFKSQILNQIEKQGLEKVLGDVNKKPEAPQEIDQRQQAFLSLEA